MSPYSPLRNSIVEEARRHILTVSDAENLRPEPGVRRGGDKLKEILSEACEVSPSWTPENLKALRTPGVWLNVNGKGGTSDSQQAVHWCGIFATYVLRKVGLDVKWRSGIGIINRGATKYLARRNRWEKKDGFNPGSFDTGDVVAIPRANHHFIVVDAPADSKTMSCIAGNGALQQIEWQTHARDEVVTHYSIIWDPYASRL